MANAGGHAVLLALGPGQASEVKTPPLLLARLRALKAVGRVAYDRGHSSDPWRAAIRAAGAEPCVPGQPTPRRAPPHDRSA